MHIYPVSEITSLVILIFLTHPRHNSSSVHSSFFSIGWGFVRAMDCEYIIGVVLLLRVPTLDKEGFSLGVLGLLVLIGLEIPVEAFGIEPYKSAGVWGMLLQLFGFCNGDVGLETPSSLLWNWNETFRVLGVFGWLLNVGIAYSSLFLLLRTCTLRREIKKRIKI